MQRDEPASHNFQAEHSYSVRKSQRQVTPLCPIYQISDMESRLLKQHRSHHVHNASKVSRPMLVRHKRGRKGVDPRTGTALTSSRRRRQELGGGEVRGGRGRWRKGHNIPSQNHCKSWEERGKRISQVNVACMCAMQVWVTIQLAAAWGFVNQSC